MAQANGSVLIEVPAHKVFNFVLDGKNNPLWRPNVLESQLMAEKPKGAGAIFLQALQGPGNLRIAGDYEITALEDNRLITFQVIKGPARPMGSYRFEEVGEHTRVSLELSLEASGGAKLMEPIIQKQLEQEVNNLNLLKTYLEKS